MVACAVEGRGHAGRQRRQRAFGSPGPFLTQAYARLARTESPHYVLRRHASVPDKRETGDALFHAEWRTWQMHRLRISKHRHRLTRARLNRVHDSISIERLRGNQASLHFPSDVSFAWLISALKAVAAEAAFGFKSQLARNTQSVDHQSPDDTPE